MRIWFARQVYSSLFLLFSIAKTIIWDIEGDFDYAFEK